MAHTARNRTDNRNYVTTQTAGGRYEAIPQIDNANNSPIQRKLNLTRYGIPEPPRMMRNLPKFYTAGKLLPRKCSNSIFATRAPNSSYGTGNNTSKKIPPGGASSRTGGKQAPRSPKEMPKNRTLGSTDGRGTKKQKQ